MMLLLINDGWGASYTCAPAHGLRHLRCKGMITECAEN